MSTTTVISRRAARKAGLKRFFTGRPCIHGHVAERYVSCDLCVECKAIQSRNYNQENREKSREACRRWRASQPKIPKLKQENDREHKRDYQKSWRQANPDLVTEYRRREREKRIGLSSND